MEKKVFHIISTTDTIPSDQSHITSLLLSPHQLLCSVIDFLGLAVLGLLK